MKIRNMRATLAGVALLSVSSSALALPDPKAPVPTAFQQQVAVDTRLQGSVTLRDAKTSVIYVSPATTKSTSGSFAATALANDAQCTLLSDMYKLTYMVPDVPDSQWQEKAKDGPFSPFFDMAFGNYIRYASLADALIAASAGEEAFKQLHKAEYSAYVEAKTLYEKSDADLTRTKLSLNALDADVQTANSLLSTSITAEERAEAQGMLNAAIATRTAELPQRKEAYRLALREEIRLRTPYAQAYAAWAPYQPNLADLATRVSSIEQTAAVVRALATQAFNFAQSTLNAIETRVVGKASAGYSLFGNEVNAAQSHLSAAPGYSVSPLPIFDVTNASRASATVVNVSSSKANVFDRGGFRLGVSDVIGGSPLIAGRVLKPASLAAFKDESERPIRPLSSDPVYQASGTFDTNVTLGAYCSGSSDRASTTHTVTKNNDVNDKFVITRPVLTRRTSNVLAQAVALDYKYYVQAEPVDVTCTLALNSTDDFARNAGKVTGLFYSRKWDDTTRRQAKDSGISCVLNGSPTGANPDQADQEQKLEAKLQKMQQEIAAEFILTYGKSWTVSTERPANPTPEESNAIGNMGTSLITLCGFNSYCAVTGLVMKTVDEIFGSTSGSTSTRDELKGSISRNYSLNSWRVDKGSAVINVTVPL